jgi:transposase
MKTKRVYEEAFKREALRLLETSGKAVAELERDLGITPGLLNKWRGRYQINPATEQVEAREERQLEAENRQLKRELEQVKAERELLKKVLRILSEDAR